MPQSWTIPVGEHCCNPIEVTGTVTDEFREMLLGLPKPLDTEIYNKMTPFFQIFLDDDFQSCHYGTENYYR